MRTIHKYALPLSRSAAIEAPQGARPLHVGHQGGWLMLWAEVDTERPPERRRFTVVGTGHEIRADAGDYIGTVQMPNGLVWHVYGGGNAD